MSEEGTYPSRMLDSKRPTRKNEIFTNSPNKNGREYKKDGNQERMRAIKAADAHSSDDKDEERKLSRRTAVEYRVVLARASHADNGLDLISLPIKEAAKNKIEFLFDTGVAISLIKLKTLKNDNKIIKEQVRITEILGHVLETLRKTYIHVIINTTLKKHPLYVIKDNAPISYDGMLGVDFIRKNKATCNYANNNRQYTINVLPM